MQHLTTEELARLVDEAPDREEAAHLEACGDCRGELECLRDQTNALRALPVGRAPDHLWPVLEARLRMEGLVAGGGALRRGRWTIPLRIAASVALFAAGGAVGAHVFGAEGAATGALAEAGGGAELRTVGEAEDAVRRAEAAYLGALTRYAELSGTEAIDPVNRLAALEGIVLTTRAALEEAPGDPVINGYHLTALSQREAMLRRIAQNEGEAWY